jgi:hypothetical protein
MYIAHEMKEPNKRDRLSLRIGPIPYNAFIFGQRGKDVHWLGLFDLHTGRLSLRFKWPINVMAPCQVVLPMCGRKFIGPPGGLHE